MVAPQAQSMKGSELVTTPDWSTIALQQVLSTPILVGDYTVLEGTAPNFDYSSHSRILATSAFMRDKVRGYMGLRATVVVRVVVNASKFTQGRICLSYMPGDLADNYVFRGDHRHVTQLTHVTLDLNTETEIVLRIPHRGPFTHFDLLNNRYNTGIFRITELLRHRGEKYTMAVYMNYEDVDLIGPTASNLPIYQSSLIKEADNREPLSSKVMSLSKVVDSFSVVPMLSAYVKPLAWATSVISGVMSAFGYSKPLNTQSAVVQYRRNRPSYNTYDGVDFADTAGLSMMTSVKVDKELGLTDQDEMSMAFLLGINSVVFRSFFSTALPAGVRLVSFPVCPWTCKSRVSVGATALDRPMIMHPLAYFSDLFDKYRGSMIYTFDFSKTIFHSARLLVVYEPFSPSNNLYNSRVVSNARTDTFDNFREDTLNCHKEIIDLRKGNKFELTIPFLAVTPYLNVEHAMGRIHVYLLNSLVAAGDVSTFVDYSVSVRAGPDFEFAVPAVPRYFPTELIGTGNNEQLFAHRTLGATNYESGLENTEGGMIVKKHIGSSKPGVLTTEFAELCIGEKILSAKQIAMRSKMIHAPTDAATLLPRHPFYVDCFLDSSMRTFTRWENNLTPGPYLGAIRVTNRFFDYYSYIGRMYAYVRGGVILTVENTTTTAIYFGLFNDHARPTLRSFNEWAPSLKIGPQEADRIYIPPYTNSHCRHVSYTPITPFPPRFTPGDVESKYNGAERIMNVVNNSGEPVNCTISRAAADDTQFGGFRGIPYMILREPYLTKSVDTVDPIQDRKLAAFYQNFAIS